MKKKGLFLLCLMLALSLPDLAAQQSGTVKGRVLDGETNEPLIGASVIISGTTRGTATDVNGNFELTDVPEKGSLDFTYLGFDTQSVAVGGRTLINITMRPTSNQIEELVVVGYNVQRKRDVLGAVNKIDGADLAQIPVPSAQLALQGRVPGVQVAASSGAPGANVSVRVRGVGSINSSNEPLYIIDGIQIEGGLNAVSPNDIEDITVLKDASATSITVRGVATVLSSSPPRKEVPARRLSRLTARAVSSTTATSPQWSTPPTTSRSTTKRREMTTPKGAFRAN